MTTNAALNDVALEVSSWIQLEVTTKCNVVNGYDDDDLWEHWWWWWCCRSSLTNAKDLYLWSNPDLIPTLQDCLFSDCHQHASIHLCQSALSGHLTKGNDLPISPQSSMLLEKRLSRCGRLAQPVQSSFGVFCLFARICDASKGEREA